MRRSRAWKAVPRALRKTAYFSSPCDDAQLDLWRRTLREFMSKTTPKSKKSKKPAKSREAFADDYRDTPEHIACLCERLKLIRAELLAVAKDLPYAMICGRWDLSDRAIAGVAGLAGYLEGLRGASPAVLADLLDAELHQQPPTSRRAYRGCPACPLSAHRAAGESQPESLHP